MALPEFRNIAQFVHEHALVRPDSLALLQDSTRFTYAELDQFMDRVGSSLQAAGIQKGDIVTICSHSGPLQAAVFLGALRVGVVTALIAPSVNQATFAAMVNDSQAKLLFIDDLGEELLSDQVTTPLINLENANKGLALKDWLAPVGSLPTPVTIDLDSPFNIIYSSGTTGVPKGIVQPHIMRWGLVARCEHYEYTPEAVSLLSTPIYSNTTLTTFFPTIAGGGCVIIMRKFNVHDYLELAQKHRVTHTMLVPVQYQRLMSYEHFDKYDLQSFKYKFCTSAPFSAQLKADVLARWPGGLVEFYGMTEGGGSFVLEAHKFPDKLHTVGVPIEGSDIRLINDAGIEVDGPEQMGEVVGHSSNMMLGYYGHPEKTREAEWYAPDGKRFIRTGDVGKYDKDGFLTLYDRKKDMLISGGFNIYPSDLEAVMKQNPAIHDVAVVGVPSEAWGETPVAYVVCHDPAVSAQEIKEWFNAQVGKTQRLADLILTDELPRSAIGKVLKRELRDLYVQTQV